MQIVPSPSHAAPGPLVASDLDPNRALRAYAAAARTEKEAQIRWLEAQLGQSAVQVIVFS
jgi:hypothetical protein